MELSKVDSYLFKKKNKKKTCMLNVMHELEKNSLSTKLHRGSIVLVFAKWLLY